MLEFVFLATTKATIASAVLFPLPCPCESNETNSLIENFTGVAVSCFLISLLPWIVLPHSSIVAQKKETLKCPSHFPQALALVLVRSPSSTMSADPSQLVIPSDSNSNANEETVVSHALRAAFFGLLANAMDTESKVRNWERLSTRTKVAHVAKNSPALFWLENNGLGFPSYAPRLDGSRQRFQERPTMSTSLGL